MNPVAKELWEEGISVKTFKLVSEGVFHEEGESNQVGRCPICMLSVVPSSGVRKLFAEAGDKPGCSATRQIGHNITEWVTSASRSPCRKADEDHCRYPVYKQPVSYWRSSFVWSEADSQISTVSANQRGATLMQSLFDEFGTAKVMVSRQ